MLLANKNILITGATRGLGLSITQTLWQQGANLILVARGLETLTQLKNQLLPIAHKHQTIQMIAADLALPLSIGDLLKNIPHPIHVLINNAAIQGPIGPAWQNDWQEWQNTLQVNLLAPIALCRAVIPHMIQQNYGKIINLSGGGATAARPNFSAYAVAKSSLVRFSETLAEEVNAYNISVNCIAPGVMNTDMLAEIVQAGSEKVGEKEFTQAQTKATQDDSVIKRAAELCAFLASPDSDGITGKLISAVWDPWQDLPRYLNDLKQTDIYTLRRITPKDRGKTWGDA
jgi:3-oxoacyl-[acyl-carrier protein] reductase